MKNPHLSIIIPAYNEAKRLPLTLLDIDKHLEKAKFSYEILVVDNNSSDGTKEIAQRFSLLTKHLRVIECLQQGKGAAVKKGMLEARGDIRLFTDADNSTSITHFFAMEHYFNEGSDVVIGSRDIPGATLEPAQPWYRRILGDAGNLFIQLMLLKGIKDTQCGFKAFSAKATEAIFPHLTISGWGFDVEVLTLARRYGFYITEIPVRWVNSAMSHVKPTAYFLVLLEVVRIKIKLLKGFYPAVHK